MCGAESELMSLQSLSEVPHDAIEWGATPALPTPAMEDLRRDVFDVLRRHDLRPLLFGPDAHGLEADTVCSEGKHCGACQYLVGKGRKQLVPRGVARDQVLAGVVADCMQISTDRLAREAFYELWSDTGLYTSTKPYSLCEKLVFVNKYWTLAAKIVQHATITVASFEDIGGGPNPASEPADSRRKRLGHSLESTILGATLKVGNRPDLLEARLRLAVPWKLDEMVRVFVCGLSSAWPTVVFASRSRTGSDSTRVARCIDEAELGGCAKSRLSAEG